jgi:hypothetical protein
LSAPPFLSSPVSAWLAIGCLGILTTAIVEPRGLHIDGPPLAHTGGFSENNCRACHWQNALNDGGVRVEIGGLPQRYQANAKHQITVLLRHEEMKNGGFQLSARFDAAALRGRQAGSFRPLDGRTKIQKNDSTGISYMAHTREGTALSSPGLITWKFEWTAPADAGVPVIFHVAANAGDDTNSEAGDYIYATSRTIRTIRLSPDLFPQR